jgi:hypothetical protein
MILVSVHSKGVTDLHDGSVVAFDRSWANHFPLMLQLGVVV